MKIRKRLRSESEYERVREKVKGPEDLEREMEKNERMAELHFALESEPVLKDALKKQVENDIREQGIESVVDLDGASPEAKAALDRGAFTVTVAPHPKEKHDAISVVLEGVVQEKLPVQPSFSERYLAQFVTMM